MKLILASALGLVLSVSGYAQHSAPGGHAGAAHASTGFSPGRGAAFSSGRSFAAPASFGSHPSSSGSFNSQPFASGSARTFGNDQASRPNFAGQQRHYQPPSAIGPPPFGATYPPREHHGPYGPRGPYANGRYWPYYPGVYGFPGLLGGGLYDYGYPADFSDQQEAAPEANGSSQTAPSGPGDQQAQASSPQDYGPQQGYGQQGYGPMEPAPRPAYQPDAGSSPDLQEQPEVTLLFKDGRPPQQVQNYAVTRKTLYVLDGGRRREIPLDQLDLPSTEKTNRDAGVDFEIPAS